MFGTAVRVSSKLLFRNLSCAIDVILTVLFLHLIRVVETSRLEHEFGDFRSELVAGAQSAVYPMSFWVIFLGIIFDHACLVVFLLLQALQQSSNPSAYVTISSLNRFLGNAAEECIRVNHTSFRCSGEKVWQNIFRYRRIYNHGEGILAARRISLSSLYCRCLMSNADSEMRQDCKVVDIMTEVCAEHAYSSVPYCTIDRIIRTNQNAEPVNLETCKNI